jgi:hypothetical protein
MRLSTLHRIAATLLVCTALMLVLPLLFPDGPARLLAAVFIVGREDTIVASLLLAAMVIALFVPLWGFILVIADILGFFFTGHRFTTADDEKVFSPRLGLTGMLVPTDELPRPAFDRISDSQQHEHLRIVIPDSDVWRAKFDKRMIRTFRIPDNRRTLDDKGRLYYALRLAVSDSWSLASESAKMELTLVRHILLIRIALLRFIKALLLVPVTVGSVLVSTSIMTAESYLNASNGSGDIRSVTFVLCAVFLLWGPIAAAAVSSPAHWIYRQSPGIGKVSDVYKDMRMVRYENGVVFLALVSGVLLAIALVVSRGIGVDPTAIWITLATAAGAWLIVLTRFFKGNILHTPASFYRMMRVGHGDYS